MCCLRIKKSLLVIPLLVPLFMMSSCHDKEALAELEAVKAQAEIEEQNKKIARKLFDLIDAQDFDGLNEILADDFALNVPGQPEPFSKDFLFQLIETHYRAFPNWIHVIEDAMAEGDKVAVKLNQNGTHEAEYEGIAATGIKATCPAMHLGTIVDGKIKEWFAVEDYLGLYMQLGMELKPKEKAT
jgi:predicted ester cyclase